MDGVGGNLSAKGTVAGKLGSGKFMGGMMDDCIASWESVRNRIVD